MDFRYSQSIPSAYYCPKTILDGHEIKTQRELEWRKLDGLLRLVSKISCLLSINYWAFNSRIFGSFTLAQNTVIVPDTNENDRPVRLKTAHFQPFWPSNLNLALLDGTLWISYKWLYIINNNNLLYILLVVGLYKILMICRNVIYSRGSKFFYRESNWFITWKRDERLCVAT